MSATNRIAAASPHVRELLMVVGAYFAYMYTRAWAFGDVEQVSFENAERLIDLQQRLGIFWEPGWQEWTLSQPKLVMLFFNWVYIFTFLPIIAVTAVTTYIRQRHRYVYYRTVIMTTFVFALIAFALVPLAPPRMIPEHFVDTIVEFGPAFYADREMANYYNAFAAMPSLHFTWSAILGVMFVRSGASWLTAAGILYPTLTLIAIIVTGNHYISDAIVAVPITLASFGTVHLVCALRERSRAPER